ncbi:hypothetical protein ACFLQV_04010 [Calditrichota bacterium]
MAQSDFWNKLKQRLRDVSSAAADFTEEQALIGKLKFDILTLKRKIDRHQKEIGEKIYEMNLKSPKPDIWKSNDIRTRIKEIEDLELQIEAKRASITEVADQVRASAVDDASVETPAPKPAAKKAAPKKPAPKKKPAAKKTTASKPKSSGSSKTKTK